MRKTPLTAASCAVVLALTACGSPGEAAGGGGDGPVRIGIVYSATGPLATYGEQYRQGLEAGLDYATGGTMEIDGRAVEVEYMDDGGDTTAAVSAARDLIGTGYDIIAGSTASGIAVQVAPLAEQDDILFISGPAATDAVSDPALADLLTFRDEAPFVQLYFDTAFGENIGGAMNDEIALVFAGQSSAQGIVDATQAAADLG